VGPGWGSASASRERRFAQARCTQAPNPTHGASALATRFEIRADDALEQPAKARASRAELLRLLAEPGAAAKLQQRTTAARQAPMTWRARAAAEGVQHAPVAALLLAQCAPASPPAPATRAALQLSAASGDVHDQVPAEHEHA
jgi:hypothetical protein